MRGQSLMPALFVGIFFTVAAGMSAQPQSIPEMAGAWSGKVSIGPALLNIVFNFGKDRDGNLTCTMESPDQGSGLLPATVDLLTGDSLSISIPGIGASYSGHFIRTGNDGEIVSAESPSYSGPRHRWRRSHTGLKRYLSVAGMLFSAEHSPTLQDTPVKSPWKFL